MQISRLVFGDRLDRRTNMRRARCAPSRAQAASCACSRQRKGRVRGGGRRGRRPWCSIDLGWYKSMYTSHLRGVSILIPPRGCAAARSPSPTNTNASRAGEDATQSFGYCGVTHP